MRGIFDLAEEDALFAQLRNIFSQRKHFGHSRRFPVVSNCTLYLHREAEEAQTIQELREGLARFRSQQEAVGR